MTNGWSRRRAAALVAATVVAAAAAGDARADDPPPVIDLYTMGPGAHMFEKFGHAAMCVRYPSGGPRARCYNYGTTDFDSVVPLFWGFLRGRSVFWVSASSPEKMIERYREADRSLWRQTLDLEPEAARRAARLLAEDALEENRYYAYHHYDDNCSTRVRDVIDDATSGALRAPREGAAASPTYRELSRLGFHESTALLLVSDLVLGRRADDHPPTFEAMFLPDVLRVEVEARLGARAELLHASESQPDAFPYQASPAGARWAWVLAALILAAPVALARWRGRRVRLALAAAFIPLALIGLVLWAIAIVSPLSEVRWNEALLLFMPWDAAVPFLREAHRRRYVLARVAVLTLVTLLLAVGLFRQPLWLLIPVPLLSLLAASWRPRA